jgi:hypothetical protein
LPRGAARGGAAPPTSRAAPPVVAALERRIDWIAELERRIGGAVALRGEPDAPIFGGHVDHRSQ